MIGEGDMAVFYDPDGFGRPCVRRRPSVADVPFVGILGAVDEIALEGYAVAAEHSLRYPSDAVDLDEGDLVLVGVERDAAGGVRLVDGAAQGGVRYRVRTEPRILNDGAESGALLSRVRT